jgi:hypothetical protein
MGRNNKGYEKMTINKSFKIKKNYFFIELELNKFFIDFTFDVRPGFNLFIFLGIDQKYGGIQILITKKRDI